MTQEDDNSQHFLARIRQELDNLPLTQAQKDKVTPYLLNFAVFLDTRGGRTTSGALRADSTFFTFADKLQAVVTHFQDQGLKYSDYLTAALKQPQLFYQSPSTITGNIEGMVQRFTAEDLTVRQYLKAALRQPSLFYQSPETIARHIVGVSERFANEGLTTRAFLAAALKQPALFAQAPQTMADNIQRVVQRFADEGLTARPYLQAALKQPELFAMSPDTVAEHITGVIDRFAADGLTARQYLKAALKQPRLFTQSADTVARHIDAVLSLADKGIFTPPTPHPTSKPRTGPSRNPSHAAVIDFLLKHPSILTLADENFALREVHQRLTDGPRGTRLLTRSRRDVEHELIQHLGHDDPQQPVPPDRFAAGGAPPTEEQAKRLVLRALIHAGFIRSGSLER